VTGFDALVLTAHPTSGTILVAKHTSTLQLRQLANPHLIVAAGLGSFRLRVRVRAARVENSVSLIYVLGDKGVGE
jgi:hypothetical protein